MYFCWVKHISPAFANIMLVAVFIMFKLSEKTILKVGGSKFSDAYNVTWVDLWKSNNDRRNWLRFYNYGSGWNVYLMSSEGKEQIQLTTISNYISFRLLLFVLK